MLLLCIQDEIEQVVGRLRRMSGHGRDLLSSLSSVGYILQRRDAHFDRLYTIVQTNLGDEWFPSLRLLDCINQKIPLNCRGTVVIPRVLGDIFSKIVHLSKIGAIVYLFRERSLWRWFAFVFPQPIWCWPLVEKHLVLWEICCIWL